jgi:hypothetical protein
MIINYDRNHSFIVLATVITIVNYDRKTFIVQATGDTGSWLNGRLRENR